MITWHCVLHNLSSKIHPLQRAFWGSWCHSAPLHQER
nr:MAG TPA: hypothetical protein [Microviridae sp.]